MIDVRAGIAMPSRSRATLGGAPIDGRSDVGVGVGASAICASLGLIACKLTLSMWTKPVLLLPLLKLT